MDKEKQQEIFEELHGIVRPFPLNPQAGEKFRRLKPANQATHEPSKMVTYFWNGIYWLEEK